MTVLLQSAAFVYLIVVQWSICVCFVLPLPGRSKSFKIGRRTPNCYHPYSYGNFIKVPKWETRYNEKVHRFTVFLNATRVEKCNLPTLNAHITRICCKFPAISFWGMIGNRHI